MENRDSRFDIMPEIAAHWSPRAFDEGRPVSNDDLLALFEAAHFAPSCFNEQPWRFIVALEARHRGLITHAMGGFSVEQVREAFLVPEDYSIMAVVAVGYYGSRDNLPPQFLEKERPNPRKMIDEIIDLY